MVSWLMVMVVVPLCANCSLKNRVLAECSVILEVDQKGASRYQEKNKGFRRYGDFVFNQFLTPGKLFKTVLVASYKVGPPDHTLYMGFSIYNLYKWPEISRFQAGVKKKTPL